MKLRKVLARVQHVDAVHESKNIDDAQCSGITDRHKAQILTTSFRIYQITFARAMRPLKLVAGGRTHFVGWQ
jgi:hypothetical protein